MTPSDKLQLINTLTTFGKLCESEIEMQRNFKDRPKRAENCKGYLIEINKSLEILI